MNNPHLVTAEKLATALERTTQYLGYLYDSSENDSNPTMKAAGEALYEARKALAIWKKTKRNHECGDKRMARLTKREIVAVLDVLNERLAGGVEDLNDALGINEKEAEEMWDLLCSAVKKLQERV